MSDQEKEEVKPIDLSANVEDAESGTAVAKFQEDDMIAENDVSAPVEEEDIPWSTRMWEVFTTFWPLGFVGKHSFLLLNLIRHSHLTLFQRSLWRTTSTHCNFA